jgi:hypothetical protein
VAGSTKGRYWRKIRRRQRARARGKDVIKKQRRWRRRRAHVGPSDCVRRRMDVVRRELRLGKYHFSIETSRELICTHTQSRQAQERKRQEGERGGQAKTEACVQEKELGMSETFVGVTVRKRCIYLSFEVWQPRVQPAGGI